MTTDSSSQAGKPTGATHDGAQLETSQPTTDEPPRRNGNSHPATNGSEGNSWFAKIFGRKRNGNNIRENLADALSEGEGFAEGFTPGEREMLTGILKLQEVPVEELMTQRADIVAASDEISLGELLSLFEKSGHSRMPVYGETLDDPLGMVHIKDVLTYITTTAAFTRAEAAKRQNKSQAGLDLKKVKLDKPLSALKLAREILFVPPSTPAAELMARMQADRVQMALVIDEYGGTDGLVSLEDIVEEIVGEIADEHDDEDLFIEDRGDGVLICNAKAELDDIRSHLGEAFSFGNHEEDVDTIGGLVFDLIGRVPIRGEVVTSHGYEFRVLEADPRRIKKIELLPASRRRLRNH